MHAPGPYAPGGGTASPRLAHVRRGGIAFDYPAAWRHRGPNFDTTMSEGRIGGAEMLEGPVVTHGRREYDAYACLGPEGRPGNAAAFRAVVRSARPA